MLKWISGRRYLLILVAVAATVLIVGSKLKPRRQTAEVVISEAERLHLQMLAQKRSLQNVSQYFSNLAERVGGSIVRLQGSSRNGVIWDRDGGLVTSADLQARATVALTAPDRSIHIADAWYTPGVPVTAMQIQDGGSARSTPVIFDGPIDPGTWIVMVSRQDNGTLSFQQGTTGGMAEGVCDEFPYREVRTSLPEHLMAPGAGIFDLEGRLVAISIPCGSRLLAMAPPTIRVALAEAGSMKGRAAGKIGFEPPT